MIFLIFLIFLFTSSLAQKLTFKGGSSDASSEVYSLLKSIGSTHVRNYIQWRYVQNDLGGHIDKTLRWDALQRLYQQNISVLDEFMEELHWNSMDRTMDMVKEAGLKSIVEIGEGTHWCLPFIKSGESEVADPNVIGRDTYLAYLYRYGRAVVRRYSTIRKQVEMYQIENELNESFGYTLIGWKRFEPFFGNAWHDWSYVTEVLKVLYYAVKDECPSCLTTQNVHSDLPKSVHLYTATNGFYIDALKDWIEYIDVPSLDMYPNYFVSQPLLPNIVGERVKAVYDMLATLPSPHNQKKVFVMETGYPASNLSHPLPPSLNFTQEHQYEWITQAVDSLVENGGIGFMYFKISKAPGILPPEGGYTKEDEEAMEVLSNLYRDEDIAKSVYWLGTHFTYLRTRFGKLAGSIENGWGLLDLEGRPRKGINGLQHAFGKY